MATATRTKLTLADINRKRISRETGKDMAWISRVFSSRFPRFMGSLRLASEIAVVLGVTTDEFITFLREECGKDI